MKRISTIALVIVLTVLMAALMPAQVFADSLPEYISEIKIYMGSCKDAEKDGFTILSKTDDNGNLVKDSKGNSIPVDLNQNAGGGLGSKGEKAVYLGYKTTTDSKEAITDLALMNMKGGYSVQEYEALMELQMKSQIIPFVDNFLATINEYRENYNSDIETNQKRAQFVHDMLNKLTDDDCDGAGLGDLFLNETKYEMGDEAYNELSDEQKKEHADILTIIAQANGQATLLMNNLLTRASDTNEDTWIDRFSTVTYDDLVEFTGKTPIDAEKELAKLYDDDANALVEGWAAFREELEEYENASDAIEDAEEFDYEAYEEKYEDFDMETASSDDVLEALTDMTEERYQTTETINNLGIVAVHDYLDSIDYEDGTLLDFFMQSEDEIEDDVTVLYPLVASLTDGQRAGMEFVSLKEFILMTVNDEETYEDEEIEKLEIVSIYEGVDRGIYEKGGVALTSEALRKNASTQQEQAFPQLSVLTKVMIGVSAASMIGCVASIVARGVVYSRTAQTVEMLGQSINSLKSSIAASQATLTQLGQTINNSHYLAGGQVIYSVSKTGATQLQPLADVPEGVIKASQEYMAVRNSIEQSEAAIANLEKNYQSAMASRATANKFMVGMTVAMVVISAITTYLAWRDMQNYYKVDFTPIPHYMVDEIDLVGYNKKGEKVVFKNQLAYYKAVECNRTDKDEFFKTLDVCADMNGDVGKQWLALYASRNSKMEPILAASLKAVVGSSEIPSGYKTGIHMFGAEASFNLNSNLYDWNNNAKSVFVYYKTDDGSASATGSNFSGGLLALSGGAGLVIGSLATALGMTVTKKKKKEA